MVDLVRWIDVLGEVLRERNLLRSVLEETGAREREKMVACEGKKENTSLVESRGGSMCNLGWSQVTRPS